MPWILNSEAEINSMGRLGIDESPSRERQKPGCGCYTPDSGTWEAEAERSQVQEQSGYTAGLCLKQASEWEVGFILVTLLCDHIHDRSRLREEMLIWDLSSGNKCHGREDRGTEAANDCGMVINWEARPDYSPQSPLLLPSCATQAQASAARDISDHTKAPQHWAGGWLGW